MRFCPKCGHPNRDTSKYCTACGAELKNTISTPLVTGEASSLPAVSLGFGIVSFCFIFGLGITILAAVIAIVTGSLSLGKKGVKVRKAAAICGLVLGILGLIASIAIMIYLIKTFDIKAFIEQICASGKNDSICQLFKELFPQLFQTFLR